MFKFIKIKLLGFLLFLLMIANFQNEVFAQGKISGYIFGDYYYIFSQNNDALKNQNGFWIRRAYFTYDYKFNDNFDSRIRLELNSPGDFKTKDTIKAFLKDGYLAYKKGNHKIIIGLSPSPTWEFIEEFWMYRSAEKTPLDLYKLGSSRDIGIAFKGAFDADKTFSYHIFIGNGEGDKSEINKSKKIMSSLLFNFAKNIYFELYADYVLGEGSKNNSVIQGFLGYKRENFRIGLSFSHIKIEQVANIEKLNLNVASLFLIFNPTDKISAFARLDKVDKPLPWGTSISYAPFNNSYAFTNFIAGMDFKILQSISIIPNIMIVKYDESDIKPVNNDFYAKLTFFYKW